MRDIVNEAYRIETSLIPRTDYIWNRRKFSGWCFKPRVATHNELTYVYDGSVVYKVNGEVLTLKQGDVLYIPKGWNKEALSEDETSVSCFTIIFHWTENGQIVERQDILPLYFHLGLDYKLLDMFDCGYTLFLEETTEGIMEANGLVALILSRLLKRINEKNLDCDKGDSLKNVKHYVNINFDKKISVEELAKLTGLQTSYFGLYFKRQTGLTVKEYVNRVKIYKAERAMAEQGLNVSEAAEYCGFSDIYYFSRLFKKIRGISPSEFI